MPYNLAILGSTRGTLLSPIYNGLAQNNINADIKLVFSNKPQAGILKKADQFNLPNCALSIGELTREEYDSQLSTILKNNNINLILLLGYMRILSPSFCNQWQNKIINIHPSLLPKHAGLMDLAVHQAVLDNHETQTGCTVHLVTPIVDAGEIICQKTCDVFPSDTAETLKSRVQTLEKDCLLSAIKQLTMEPDYV